MTLPAALIVLTAFVLGYLLGRVELLLDAIRGSGMQRSSGFFAKTSTTNRTAPQNPVSAIEIDERKVVSQIKTDSLQKVTDIQLGKQVVAQDDIDASANRLATLKRS